MTDTRPLSQRAKWVLASRKALHERTDPGTPPEQLAYSYALDISNTGVLEVDDVMEQLLNIVGYRVEPQSSRLRRPKD